MLESGFHLSNAQLAKSSWASSDLVKDILGCSTITVCEVVVGNGTCVLSSWKETQDPLPVLGGAGGLRGGGRAALPVWCCYCAPSDPSARYAPSNPKYRVFSKTHFISDMDSLRGIDS